MQLVSLRQDCLELIAISHAWRLDVIQRAQWLRCPGPALGYCGQGLRHCLSLRARQDSMSFPRRISKSGQVASMLTSPFNRLKYVSLAVSISSSYDLRNSLPKLFSKPPLPRDDGDIAILTKTNITWLTCARIFHNLACKQCVTTRQKEIWKFKHSLVKTIAYLYLPSKTCWLHDLYIYKYSGAIYIKYEMWNYVASKSIGGGVWMRDASPGRNKVCARLALHCSFAI